MKSLLVNYNYTPEWIKEYPELEVTMYDRSDDGIERNLTQYGGVYRSSNVGDVDYDKLGWIIENYENLPDVFLWSKTNIFKFITPEEFDTVLEAQKKNPGFAPLLTKNHKVYGDRLGDIAKYRGDIYCERNDSWYFHAGLDASGRFNSWQDWADTFFLPKESFIPFAPGGSYILTPDRIHRYSKDFYEDMRSTLPYARRPVEAHCCERSYYYLWK